MRKLGGWALGLLLVTGLAWGEGGKPGDVRKQIESSLLVKGAIDINADGSVAAHTLERESELPVGIVAMIGKAVPQWRFEPIKLKEGTQRARANMSIRIVARKLDDGNFAVDIRGAQFGQEQPDTQTVRSKDRLTPPRYPEKAAYAGVGGSVYLVLKVGRDGQVIDAVAEQVNLRVVTNGYAMTRWRDMLAKSAMAAAMKWTFTPPTEGEEVAAPYWSVRVPVDFIAPGQAEPKDYAWTTYVPGPRQLIPWRTEISGAGADALVAGGVYPLDSGLQLKTPLGGS
ncbi:protein tonB [Lysobacter cavernae]|uniref:Protein tonB n=1 Tax=Lysobacter cavernae TaxID=1685901 RepID=A0ABV7RM10_9GAMM